MARSGGWGRCWCARVQGTHPTEPRQRLYHQENACRLMWYRQLERTKSEDRIHVATRDYRALASGQF